VFSAFGIGFSGLGHEYSVPLAGNDAVSAREVLLERARRDMFGEGVSPAECSFEARIRSTVDGAISDVVWTNGSRPPAGEHVVVRATRSLPTFNLAADVAESPRPAAPSGKRRIHLGHGPSGVTEEDVPVYDGDILGVGQVAEGPALVAGDYITALIEAGWRFRVSSNHDLILEAQR
jgi:N-methylhydantoinase A/oxoprolinase/acetone carboxylase beta subunit